MHNKQETHGVHQISKFEFNYCEVPSTQFSQILSIGKKHQPVSQYTEKLCKLANFCSGEAFNQ
jgi:hypothetical protein